jgi:hypothetical protein
MVPGLNRLQPAAAQRRDWIWGFPFDDSTEAEPTPAWRLAALKADWPPADRVLPELKMAESLAIAFGRTH